MLAVFGTLSVAEHIPDRLVREGTVGIVVACSMFGGGGLLLGLLMSTSHNHSPIIIAIATLFILGCAVTLYSGPRLSRGREQGGQFGLRPRTVRRLWAAAEFYTCATAFLTAVGGVLLAAALLLAWVESEFWLLFSFNLFTCLSMAWIWTLVRDRRRKRFPRGGN